MAQPIRSRMLNPVTASVFAGATGVAAALLIGAASMVVAASPASALPAYAQNTGKGCGYCHTKASGGGGLTAKGAAYKANGHKF